MVYAYVSSGALGLMRAVRVPVVLAVLFCSNTLGQFNIFTDRATWEAALFGVKNEDLNSFTGPTHDLRTGGACNGPLGIGDYTFSSTIACVGGKASIVQSAAGVNGTSNLAQFGTNSGGRTDIDVVINRIVHGIGFDYACANIRWRVDVPGNSGLHTEQIDCGGSGFLGIIDNQGGISSYTLYSDPSPNFDTLSVDNLALGESAPGDVSSGLAAWFRADAGVTADMAGLVSRWEDQSGNGRDALQPDPAFQPELRPNVLGGHPTMRFETDSMPFDGTFLANSNYTVFAVEGRDRFGVANFFLGGGTAGVNQNLVLGYENESLLRQAHFGNDLDAVVPAYNGTQDFALTTFAFDMSEGRTIQRSGLPAASDTSTAPLTSYAGAELGAFPALGFFYEGDIAEIIIYDRALSCDERNAVNEALGDKYGVPFTPQSCGADLVVTKTDSVDPAIAGTSLTYTVRVDNNGPGEAQNVVVVDNLPAGMTFVATSGCNEDPNGFPTCTLGNMPASTGGIYEIIVTVDDGFDGVLTNSATASSLTVEANPGDETGMESTTIIKMADLRLEVVDFPDPVLAGGVVTHIYTIINDGPSAVTDIQLDVLWPGGVRLTSITPPAGGNCTEGVSGVNCNLGSLGMGGSTQVTTVVRLPTELLGQLQIQSTIGSPVDDPDPANNTVEVITLIEPTSDLSLQLLAPPLVFGDRPFRLKATVLNLGPVTESGGKLELGVPGILKVIDVLPPSGAVCGRTPALITCNLPRLVPQQDLTIPIVFELPESSQVPITGSVFGINLDLDPTNNSDTFVVRSRVEGDLNGDGVVDVEDIGNLIREINDGDGDDAANAAGGSHPGNALYDLNGDGSINRLDLQRLARIILQKEP